MSYDPENVFAKILCDEIPSDRVYEDDEFIAFRDIAPMAPTHILVIPRLVNGVAPTSAAALTDADAGMVGRLVITATKIARDLNLDASGYRLVLNSGADAGQDVFHIHLHILGGQRLGSSAGGNSGGAPDAFHLDPRYGVRVDEDGHGRERSTSEC